MKKKKKFKLSSIMNNPVLNDIILKIPSILVFLLLCIVPPVGAYVLIKKTKNKKKKVYRIGEMLVTVGMFIFIMVGISIYDKIKEIIVLYDTGMSLDMIDLSIKFWDCFGLIAFISCMIAGIKLLLDANLQRKYVTLINVKKKKSIKSISSEVKRDVNTVIEDISDLIDKGYLLHVDIDEETKTLRYINKDYIDLITIEKRKSIKEIANKMGLSEKEVISDLKELIKEEFKGKVYISDNEKDLVYTEVVRPESEIYRVKCIKCNAIELLKEREYYECDLCGHPLSILDKL